MIGAWTREGQGRQRRVDWIDMYFGGRTNKLETEQKQFTEKDELRMILGLSKWWFHCKNRQQLVDRVIRWSGFFVVVFSTEAFIASLKYHKKVLGVIGHLIVSIDRQLLDFIHQPAGLFPFQKHRHHLQIFWYSHL